MIKRFRTERTGTIHYKENAKVGEEFKMKKSNRRDEVGR